MTLLYTLPCLYDIFDYEYDLSHPFKSDEDNPSYLFQEEKPLEYEDQFNKWVNEGFTVTYYCNKVIWKRNIVEIHDDYEDTNE